MPDSKNNGLKVALVHDHLVQDGGAERVLRSLMRVYPDAPIYTLLYDPRKMGPDFAGKDIRTSVFQRIPLLRRHYKFLLTWIDWAFRRFNFSKYDLVVSSASGWAKGVRTGSGTLHVCYCHTPIRYIWSQGETYIAETGYPAPLKAVFRVMRPWFKRKDLRAAAGVDDYVANSGYVAERIKKYYGRESTVIYPPVDTSQFDPSANRDDYFLVATRLEPYKRVELVIEAFNQLRLPLKIMGSGTDESRLKKLAGPTVEFTGRVSDAERKELFGRAQAFLNPQEEDFGITAVEALASGTPVIAYGKGGAAEILTAGTGILFSEQTAAAISQAVTSFDRSQFDSAVLRRRAEDFSAERFERELSGHIERVYRRRVTEVSG